MHTIIKKLMKKVPQKSMLYQDILLPLHFSFRYTLLGICHKASRKFHLRRLAQAAAGARNLWIQNYLNRMLEPVLQKYQTDANPGQFADNAPIWLFWWTGLEDAPELIRHCIHSVRRHAGSHPVHVLTRENYAQYIQLPDHLLQKLQAGKMGLAHFSDCVRVILLAQYGGLWLDATMFASRPIPEDYFSYPLFTCKGPVRESEFISNYRWAGFCLGGWRGNVFYRYLADAFDVYWHSCDYAITYLFFDYIIKAAYDRIPSIRRMLNELPDNNVHRDDLHQAMNDALPAETLDIVLKEDTCLYKLNWKARYALTASEGGASVYARFLEEME